VQNLNKLRLYLVIFAYSVFSDIGPCFSPFFCQVLCCADQNQHQVAALNATSAKPMGGTVTASAVVLMSWIKGEESHSITLLLLCDVAAAAAADVAAAAGAQDC
jgi:hypothetical protein